MDFSKIRIPETAWQNKTAWRLYQENWRLLHEIAYLRDGYVCQIPECKKRERLDLDHVFSRVIKWLFFEPNNVGWLCRDHHCHKSKRKGGWVDKTVDQICQLRAGGHWYDWALFKAKKACDDFRKVYYQEQINMKLKEKLAEMNTEIRVEAI